MVRRLFFDKKRKGITGAPSFSSWGSNMATVAGYPGALKAMNDVLRESASRLGEELLPAMRYFEVDHIPWPNNDCRANCNFLYQQGSVRDPTIRYRRQTSTSG